MYNCCDSLTSTQIILDYLTWHEINQSTIRPKCRELDLYRMYGQNLSQDLDPMNIGSVKARRMSSLESADSEAWPFERIMVIS